MDSPAARAIATADSASVEENERGMMVLDAAIATLPQTLKEPLLLTVFEGLSQKEAAQSLNVSVKAVETRIYRARQKQAQVLTQKMDETGF